MGWRPDVPVHRSFRSPDKLYDYRAFECVTKVNDLNLTVWPALLQVLKGIMIRFVP